MTEDLLCIGGPLDGQFFLTEISCERVVIDYKSGPENTRRHTSYYRNFLCFGDSQNRVDFLVHESLSLKDAVIQLLKSYKDFHSDEDNSAGRMH